MFTPFPRFPRELREKIWEMAIHAPPLVTMRLRTQELCADIPKSFTRPIEICTETDVYPIPTPLLHTSAESRDVALRHYEEVFDGIEGVKKMLFDLKRDVLCLESDKVFTRFCDGEPDPYPYGYHQVRFVPLGVQAWQKKVQKLALSGVSLGLYVTRILDLVKGALNTLYLEIELVGEKERRAEEDWLRRALTEGWMKTLGTDDCNGLPVIVFVTSRELYDIGRC